MKCTSKNFRLRFLCILCVLTIILTACGNVVYDMEYTVTSGVSAFDVISREDTKILSPFAANLCIASVNITDSAEVDMARANSAILCDLNQKNTIYAKNVHESLNPASLTKVMTALVALRYGSLNQVLTASNTVNITESGATLCGLKTGDTMTLDQALRILLIYSANDVAVMIAENIGGSVEQFAEMMNQEAARIGATNTNFVNPHGLTNQNHYTTVYDLYLIFNEAMKYETFGEIIQMTSYQTTYYDKNGNEKKFDKSTTNGFLKGNYNPPANITVIGGKTGTTAAAGHCLMILVRDVEGSPYIAIVMGEPSTDELYNDMVALLGEIHS